MKPLPYEIFVQNLSDLMLVCAVDELEICERTGMLVPNGVCTQVQERAVEDVGRTANRPTFTEGLILEEIARRWKRDQISTNKPAVITRNPTTLTDQDLVWALHDLRNSSTTIGKGNDRFSTRYTITESAALREAARRFEQHFELKTLHPDRA